MPFLPRASFFVLSLGLSLSCSARSVPDDDMGVNSSAGSMGETDGPEAGVQPSAAGAMYSPCERSAQCPPQEFCVFPQGESGYCTSACATPTDPSNCDPSPGDQLQTCFDIGLQDGRWVCALECARAPCPRGMRCEQVASGGSERAICF